MSVLFNEVEADQEVIKVLLRQLNKGNTMSKYFRDTDGTVYIAHHFEKVTNEQLQAQVDGLNNEIANVSEFITPVDATVTEQAPVVTDTTADTTTTTEAPAEIAPAVEASPVVDTPADQASTETVASTEEQAAPESPVVTLQ